MTVVRVEDVELDEPEAERGGRRVVVGLDETLRALDEGGRVDDEEGSDEDKDENKCGWLDDIELGVDVANTVAVSYRVKVACTVTVS